MNDMTNYSGNPIDASWKTAPWNGDGQTIEKGTQTETGELTMTELPDEVDEDELTETQEQIIRAAVRNPTYSAGQIAEMTGCTESYPSRVMNNKVPNWYENTFKTTGKSTQPIRNDRLPDDADYAETHTVEQPDDADYSEPDNSTPTETATPGASESQDSNWQAYALVGCVCFIIGLLWGGRDDW